MKHNPCTWIRRVRYPKTSKGRRKYIEDSLSEFTLVSRITEIAICLILLPVLIPLLIYVALKWIVLQIFRLRFNVRSSFWFLVEREKYFKSLSDEKKE